jgi:hypothetical protein
MLKLPRVAVCLPVLLAVLVSGCGSTPTASTTTTTASTPTTGSTNTGTTLPAVKGAKTATQSTAAKQPTHTTVAPPQPQPREKTPREKTAEAKRKREEGPVENSTERREAARASFEKAPPHQYPRFFQIRFIVRCEHAKGSHSSCECILTKLEKLPGEKDKSLAELLALELEFKNGVPLRRVAGLPRRVQRITNECRSK